MKHAGSEDDKESRFPSEVDKEEWEEEQKVINEPWAQKNCFTANISLLILLSVCHTIIMMQVWRIWYWIN